MELTELVGHELLTNLGKYLFKKIYHKKLRIIFINFYKNNWLKMP